jgi:hypothetical protein
MCGLVDGNNPKAKGIGNHAYGGVCHCSCGNDRRKSNSKEGVQQAGRNRYAGTLEIAPGRLQRPMFVRIPTSTHNSRETHCSCRRTYGNPGYPLGRLVVKASGSLRSLISFFALGSFRHGRILLCSLVDWEPLDAASRGGNARATPQAIPEYGGACESALAAGDPKMRAEFLKIAAVWDELAKGKSVLSNSEFFKL